MSTNTDIKPTRIEEDGKPILIAGISAPLSANIDVPNQWAKFGSKQHQIPDQNESSVAYGLCLNMGNEKQSEYLCGVEVSEVENLPTEFSYNHVPAHAYAVFEHTGHVSTIRQTIDDANSWINQSDYELASNAHFFFERYGEDFNPQKGRGDIEIWIPIDA